MLDLLSWLGDNWHKVLVVALALLHFVEKFERSKLFTRLFGKKIVPEEKMVDAPPAPVKQKRERKPAAKKHNHKKK
jgi:hypothetical protein